jgi:hypothetical protein
MVAQEKGGDPDFFHRRASVYVDDDDDRRRHPHHTHVDDGMAEVAFYQCPSFLSYHSVP